MPNIVMLCEPLAYEEAKEYDLSGWNISLKYDGTRCLVQKENGKIKLINRRGADISNRYPELIADLQGFMPDNSVLDGEVVVFSDRDRHISDYSALMQRESTTNDFMIRMLAKNLPAHFVWFDVLKVQNVDLKNCGLHNRVDAIEDYFLKHNSKNITLPYTFRTFKEGWDYVVENGLEGLVVKHKQSPYVFERSPSWKKIKYTKEESVCVKDWEINPAGKTLIVVDSAGKEHRVQSAGHQSGGIMKGDSIIIEYLNKTQSGAYRMPVFKGGINNG